ncbi:helix-turn-helix transcriptional regulator [Promicromonospora iranensis]|uniref:DNA-binding CsgD family transcriptional regulator n=1 Tax=Promicromonospora iranensis TaxID=1105144 RepID=A0ABU2CK19_9MICO|nr:helix-turn-helix transcriptional regulator [Promicromonospora iranensis]MDR7381673.1 DNA-binding CsgD family transcriptional regulator [Promicromonospora iranensis]
MTGLDPTTLVVSGLSGIGKSVTVLAALHRIGAQASAVRLVRSGSSRPYAQALSGRLRLDLSGQTAPIGTGPGYELDAAGLLEALGSGVGPGSAGPGVLFVDDLDVLSAGRAAWLQQLGDLAYERGWRILAAARYVPEGPLPDDVEVLDLGPLDTWSLRRFLDGELRTPLAADVAERLHWWSSGNPRVALELADSLDPGQRRGGAHWAGPDVVGPVARRSFHVLLGGLDLAATSRLAQHRVLATGSVLDRTVDSSAVRSVGLGTISAPPGHSGGVVDRLGVRYPLLALLCREQAGGAFDDGASSGRTPDGMGPDGGERPVSPVAATAAEVILDGLHLDAVAGLSAGERAPRAAARAVGVALLSGATWAQDGAHRWTPATIGSEWTDHLWWRPPAAVDEARSAAGERAAAALVVLERTGRLADPAGLRADLEVIGASRHLDWVGVCLQVRARLLLGDGTGARRLLEDQSGTSSGRTVAEIVARHVAAARVAMFDGRAADVRECLARVVDLRPSATDWLPVQGLQAAAAAMLDGKAPTALLPLGTEAWSTRALGEFAVDLGAAHLAVGQAERAAELLGLGLERCQWPYRGRVQARADLAEAVLASRGIRGEIPRTTLAEPPIEPEEWRDADTRAAHTRLQAILAAAGARTEAVEDWLPASVPPTSPWQRLRTLVAYGRYCLAHGDRAASEPALTEGRALARLAGTPGWRTAIDACLAGLGTSDGPGWARLSGNDREFVRLALRGATNAQIAGAAYVSERTVANRLRQIYALLRVRDRKELTELATVDPPGWLTGQG